MPDKKKPDEIQIDDIPNEGQPKSPDEIVPAEPAEIQKQANPDEVPPLPDDDKEFDREPKKTQE